MIRTSLAIALALVAAGAAAPALAQGEPSGADCSAGDIAWNKAREQGAPGRRNAVKAVLAAKAAGDANAGPCLSRKVRQDLVLIANGTSASEGWAPLLRENRNNIDASKAQPAKDQCAAITLFADGWSAFHKGRADIPELVGSALLRERQTLCGA